MSSRKALLFTSLLFAAAVPSTAFADLFFSEYIEGSSNNKALEIYNDTGADVNLANGEYNARCSSTVIPSQTSPST